MSSRLVVNSVRHTGASADALTLSSDGKVTFPNNTGNILQVVQTVKTSFFSNESIDTIYDVTGATVNITPSSSSSKIYTTITGAFSNARDEAYGYLLLARTISGTTVDDILIGDTGGSATRATFPMIVRASGAQHGAWAFAIQYLDSPNTTSQVTYKLQALGRYPSNCLISIGGTYSTSDHNKGRVPTIITAMEVAA